MYMKLAGGMYKCLEEGEVGMYPAMCHVHLPGRWHVQIPEGMGTCDVSGHVSFTCT